MSESLRRQVCCLKEQLADIQEQIDIIGGGGTEVDNQVLSLVNNILTLSGGLVGDTTIDLTPYLDDTDINTDEQIITQFAVVPDPAGDNVVLTIQGGNTVSIPLSDLQDGTGTDDQLLSLSGSTLSIESGNTIDLSQFEETLSSTIETKLMGFSAGDVLPTGVASYSFNSATGRVTEGRYTVTFTSAHPAGEDYAIALTLQSDEPDLDQAKITYTNKTANGFEVVITVDDNGENADLLEDRSFDYYVTEEVSFINTVTLT